VGETTEDFYAAGFDALAKGWDKCISVGGGYVEKCLSLFRISQVLYFILSFYIFTDPPRNYNMQHSMQYSVVLAGI
jgi:hypothetical protein